MINIYGEIETKFDTMKYLVCLERAISVWKSEQESVNVYYSSFACVRGKNYINTLVVFKFLIVTIPRYVNSIELIFVLNTCSLKTMKLYRINQTIN